MSKSTKKPGESRLGKLIVISKSPRINVQTSRTGPHITPVIEKKYNFVPQIDWNKRSYSILQEKDEIQMANSD